MAAIVAIGVVVVVVWKVSAVQLTSTETASRSDVKTTAGHHHSNRRDAAASQSTARISNSAIVGSISFSTLFQISIVFAGPFGFPTFLQRFAAWICGTVSLDLGQVVSPECMMEGAAQKALLFKFLITVSTPSCFACA